MPFNGVLLVSVAKTSAEVWQFLSCLPDPIDSEQLLDLVICFPLQQLGRLALCVWTFLCVPPDPYYYRRYSYNSSDSSSSSSFYDEEDFVGEHNGSPPVPVSQYYYSSSSSHSD